MLLIRSGLTAFTVAAVKAVVVTMIALDECISATPEVNAVIGVVIALVIPNGEAFGDAIGADSIRIAVVYEVPVVGIGSVEF